MLEFFGGNFRKLLCLPGLERTPYTASTFNSRAAVGSRPGLRGHWLCASRLFYHAWINMESPLVVSSSESSRGTSFHGHADCS